MRTIAEQQQILFGEYGRIVLNLVSDWDGSVRYDTRISIDTQSQYFCTIAGAELENFLTDFQTLLTKYAI